MTLGKERQRCREPTTERRREGGRERLLGAKSTERKGEKGARQIPT